MTITRVIRDDVEFFTIDATGDSGMSESGLARICGVTRQAISICLRDLIASKTDRNWPEPMQREDIWWQAKGVPGIDRSKICNFSVVRAEVYAQVANRVTTKTDRNTFKALPPRSSRSQPRANLGLQAKPIDSTTSIFSDGLRIE